MGKPTVYVCRGADCRSRKRKWGALLEVLDPVATVKEVPCQRICDAPVVGLEVDGCMEWFSEVETAKARAALVTLVTGGELKKPLRKRLNKKRQGKLRS